MELTPRPSCSMRLKDGRTGKARPPPLLYPALHERVYKGLIEFEVR